MHPGSMAYYEARMTISSSMVCAILMLLGYAAFVGWSQQAGAPPLTATDMTNDLLLILPLCVALGIAHVMTLEVESRMVELRASYAEPRWLLPLVRTINTLAITLSLILVGSFVLWVSYGPYDLFGVWFPTISPTICLIGATLLTGSLSGNYWVAAGVALAWWFFDIQTRGEYTQLLFLFNERWPLADIHPTQNRIAVSTLGVILMVVNGIIGTYRRHIP
ncbi:MAG: hypothetical protein GFH27_549325n78 [Chloroflexi bacterium AL-W]|nr:hypothetical protein [Chloroflexi bacterium AL-N1]NOK70072.1 hypothetical protein [Chloroflexi bacterium AL-N10]NOK77916.1 hypothetical protein [Chloroflexi bacterium AL-N5]NOK84925.1 hypothetical protein [Chloroflexi bacterium AL-W]NOK91904.1 hypothetical protein [Chloroflexi bacterium AL-N15]